MICTADLSPGARRVLCACCFAGAAAMLLLEAWLIPTPQPLLKMWQVMDPWLTVMSTLAPLLGPCLFIEGVYLVNSIDDD